MAAHQIDQISSNPEPIHPDLMQAIFFQNERHIGYDPQTNEPIWTGSRPMAHFRPKMERGPDGEMRQEMRKHAVSGVPLVGVRELESVKDEVHVYKKISDGRGNVYREACEHPDLLQLRYRQEQEEADAMERGMQLVRDLGRSGYTMEQLRSAIDGRPEPTKAVMPEPAVPPIPMSGGATPPAPVVVSTRAAEQAKTVDELLTDPAWPKMYGPGMWYLSPEHEAACTAGEQKAFKGNKAQAEDARKILVESEVATRAQSDAVPAY